ncbi:FAD-dependent oxidoreductase [Pedobacter nyackensis]|uniref:Rieske [2Fe-2S] domain-containing protein n=1 Tax=Pedobacter nyackensis TaxID=475255 RepID=A0A1W2A852_9SPHI|nr:FAD-dependent oxidoreductase [Pedobacter nyackensis]SMC56652.1 Rieske [2Fe-2S] domain-containing protein [Pedobacter nyackensis]
MENSKQNASLRDSCSVSPWQNFVVDSSEKLIVAEVDLDKMYDCLIIGAGITGITTALLLQRSGQACIIAEAQQPGFGTTGGTSAHLNTFFDATYAEVESDFGRDSATLLAQAGKEALSIIKGFVKDLSIDCDLESKSAWLYAENEKESKQLKEILEASKRAGVEVEADDKNIVPVPFDSVIRYDQQGQFHPLKYIHGLLAEFIALGGLLLENARIRENIIEDGIHTAISNDLTIKAKNLVYATHIPPGVNLMSFRNAPYRSYVLGLKLKDENYPDGLAYDLQEPYHYFRTHIIDGQKYLIVGGEDHKTGHEDPERAFQNLKEYASQYYEVESVAYQWSAQYYVPVDGLPYIGQLPGVADGIYVATGFNGNGMMYGTLSGKIISDLVLGKENEYTSLFSPSRLKPVAGFTDFVKETADVVWHFFSDRFSSEELQELNDLKPGEGKLAKFEGRQLAIYKDDCGKVTALNPICTHAGCTVQFNAAEQSWDCPCHGGRYDVSGKVLNAPPTKGLDAVLISYDVRP